MRNYPALSVRTAGDPDLVGAAVDDFRPTAIEARASDIRIFFADAHDRDQARRALLPHFDVVSIDVSDEDWARRSQEHLEPVVVGRLIVMPSAGPPRPQAAPLDTAADPLAIVIVPSMGFGTGHHATTRLCLDGLQRTDPAGRDVLDVGTGSGVLAIAASLLGAASAVGVDVDADAIQSARENLALNPLARRVEFVELDLARAALPDADIVTANLTGGLLVRAAPQLTEALRPAGTLILSGILAAERHEVRRAFGDAAVVWEREEDGWVGLAVKKT